MSSPVYTTPRYIDPLTPHRRALVDEKCWELAEHFLAEHPRARHLNRAEYELHVEGLAVEFQSAADNFSLPEE